MGLPRSGTTLLQRVLSSHPEITSVAEPWLLLPLLAGFNASTTRSVYGHKALEQALDDLKVEAKNFQPEYDKHVRSFINAIYTPLRGAKKYFLDKTPRYYLIAEELHRLFPEAKFIYLFRNPIDVYDSEIETFFSNHLDRLSTGYLDLENGLNLLCKPFENVVHQHVLKVTYEDFCTNSHSTVERICDYLEIDMRKEMLTQYQQVQFSGRFGDPKRDKSNGISHSHSQQPLSQVRRRIYKSWLENISDLTWRVAGYKREELFFQLENRPVAGLREQFRDYRALNYFLRKLRITQNLQMDMGLKNQYGSIFY